jgi:hypothetical protein
MDRALFEVQPVPDSGWVATLDSGMWVWLTKESEPARVVCRLNNLNNGFGTLAILRYTLASGRLWVTALQHWRVSTRGLGYDAKRLLEPMAPGCDAVSAVEDIAEMRRGLFAAAQRVNDLHTDIQMLLAAVTQLTSRLEFVTWRAGYDTTEAATPVGITQADVRFARRIAIADN